MIHRKIVPAFTDERGAIADVLYKAHVDHVGVIDSVAGALRGNHYHEKTTQHALVMRGSMRYFWQPADGSAPVESAVVRAGEMATSAPGEVHAMFMLKDCEMVVLSEGVRGGADYEKDTFRQTIVTLEEARAQSADLGDTGGG